MCVYIYACVCMHSPCSCSPAGSDGSFLFSERGTGVPTSRWSYRAPCKPCRRTRDLGWGGGNRIFLSLIHSASMICTFRAAQIMRTFMTRIKPPCSVSRFFKGPLTVIFSFALFGAYRLWQDAELCNRCTSGASRLQRDRTLVPLSELILTAGLFWTLGWNEIFPRFWVEWAFVRMC